MRTYAATPKNPADSPYTITLPQGMMGRGRIGSVVRRKVGADRLWLRALGSMVGDVVAEYCDDVK